MLVSKNCLVKALGVRVCFYNSGIFRKTAGCIYILVIWRSLRLQIMMFGICWGLDSKVNFSLQNSSAELLLNVLRNLFKKFCSLFLLIFMLTGLLHSFCEFCFLKHENYYIKIETFIANYTEAAVDMHSSRLALTILKHSQNFFMSKTFLFLSYFVLLNYYFRFYKPLYFYYCTTLLLTADLYIFLRNLSSTYLKNLVF